VTYHGQAPAVPQVPIGLTLVRVVRGRARPVVPAVVPPAVVPGGRDVTGPG
jgi:hypothetical protein